MITQTKITKKEKMRKSYRKKKFKSKEKSNSLCKIDSPEINDGFDKQNGDSKKARKKRRMEQRSANENVMLDRGGEGDQNDASQVSPADENCLQGMKGKSMEVKKKKKRKRERDSSKEVDKSRKEEGGTFKSDVYLISSGDEDDSTGMKKWITECHQSRQGLDILQQKIDEYLTAYEEQLERERKEREAQAAEGGWTVVTHHKGRKKTTDVESGITVGSVALAAVEEKMTRKKDKGVGLHFYGFQRKEAKRNEIMMLQSKFEQDKRRIQQLRAARKFRPY